MGRFSFNTFLTSNLRLEESLVREMVRQCERRFFKSGTYLLREGERNPYIYFVEEGLLRKYGIDDKGREHILQFGPENWFVTNRESSYMSQPSRYFIQAWEDTHVLLLDDNFLSRLSQKIVGFSDFNTRLLHNHIFALNKRIYELLSATAEERYLSFIETYPDILLRVPLWMVASYLGITPESLSRVRKDLARQNSGS